MDTVDGDALRVLAETLPRAILVPTFSSLSTYYVVLWFVLMYKVVGFGSWPHFCKS